MDLRRCELAATGQLDRRGNRTSPKTTTAARTIQLDTTTVGRLKAWHDDQAERRTRAGTDWQDLDIVASTSHGTPVDRHSLARSLHLLCRRVSIAPPITPYELRHTAISMQANAGRSSWELSNAPTGPPAA
ncbi:MAG: hypothetical protein GY926_05930 [bacterium]|nr:hypothetical protein [bacterium]